MLFGSCGKQRTHAAIRNVDRRIPLLMRSEPKHDPNLISRFGTAPRTRGHSRELPDAMKGSRWSSGALPAARAGQNQARNGVDRLKSLRARAEIERNTE